MLVRTPRITAYTDDPSWTIKPCEPWRPWFKDVADAWKSCLPLSIASQMGWVITCPHAFRVCWMGRPDPKDLLIEMADDDKGAVSSHFGSGVLTFSLPIKFTTNSPFGLLVTGPLNTVRPGVHPLSGYVETHWSPYPFTMNWKVAEVGRWISFEKDAPICMIMPFNARTLERTQVSLKPNSAAPVKLRERFEAWLKGRMESIHQQPVERDRLYLQGRCPVSRLKMTRDHLLKLTLRKFTT